MTPHRTTTRRRAALTSSVAIAIAVAAVSGGMLANPATAASDQENEIQEHLTEATKNSGGDLDLINSYRSYSCDAVEDPGMYSRTSAERKSTRVPLTQIFDDVWYIGSMYVGQYIIQSESGGFVLIDALNNSAEVDEYTVPALKALGVGEEHPLEAVLLSHGHGDHDGGAKRLRELYGPDLDIYVGSGDASGKTYAPITVDSSVAEPQELTVGGTEFVIQSIPGHTPGALNFVVPVHQGDDEFRLLMGGRQGHPKSVAAAQGYLTGTERTYQLAKAYNVDGTFLTHPTSDGSTVRMQTIEREGRDGKNPFIIGNDRTLRAASIWRGCAAAWLASVDAETDVPVWRFTDLSLPSLNARSREVSASIITGWGASNDGDGWGPLIGETVTFSVEGSDAQCTAKTDAAAVASCKLPVALAEGQQVRASFAGSDNDNYVNLASSASTTVQAALPDSTRPEVELTSPTVAGPLSTLDIVVNATDDAGLGKIVANVYGADDVLVKSTQTAVADAAVTGTHTASLTLPDGNYYLKYNAQDLAGNISKTGRFAFSIDATAPQVTVKEGDSFTVKTGETYDLISFKLHDAGKVDKFSLNGQVADLSDNAWSDVNFIKPNVNGAVTGDNELIVHDLAGNTTKVSFTLN